jgi:membrane-bound lytic murein transglycosylase B
MKLRTMTFAAVVAATFLLPSHASAQRQVGKAIVSIYHAAPGQQVALMKWVAQQDRVAAAAGVPAGQLYVHTDGAEWDYLVIQPVTTPAQDAAMEIAAKRLGVDVGPRSGVEFRKHILSHTDTFVAGPTTAASYLASVGEQ